MECIRAIIPVAGLSSRMGDFKPLLMLHGRTLIENCVSNLLKGGAETVTVVTGYRADEIERTLSSSFGRSVDFIRNDDFAGTDMLHEEPGGDAGNQTDMRKTKAPGLYILEQMFYNRPYVEEACGYEERT